MRTMLWCELSFIVFFDYYSTNKGLVMLREFVNAGFERALALVPSALCDGSTTTVPRLLGVKLGTLLLTGMMTTLS